MTSLGIWSCQWREMRPMSFGGKGKTTPGLAEEDNRDVEGSGGPVDFGRGRGRGRGRDGGGEYEMVGLKEPHDGDG